LSLTFKKKTTNVFLDSSAFQTPSIIDNQRYRIILSPSLYWVKKITLPIKYLRDVKKILPSIFEEIVPEGIYSYYAYKEGSEYIAFAYEDKKILDLLGKYSILINDVSSVHFAQSEFENITQPYKINDTQVLSVHDGICILSPKEWFGELDVLDISKLKTSNKKIVLKQFNHIVDTKVVYKIDTGLLLFILILSTELIIGNKKINAINQQKEAVIQKYHMKRTMMQNNSILAHYQSIFTKQKKLRKIIGLFLKVPLTQKQKISLLALKEEKLSIEIEHISSKKDAHPVLEMLNKEHLVSEIRYKNNKMQIEVKI